MLLFSTRYEDLLLEERIPLCSLSNANIWWKAYSACERFAYAIVLLLPLPFLHTSGLTDQSAPRSVYFHPLSDGKNILISAHGNSLRALYKFLFEISDDKINELEIPTGNPLMIEFENNFKIKKFFYLDGTRAKNIIINQ